MTLRALEMQNIWMQILRGMFVERKKKKKKKSWILFYPAFPFFHQFAQSSFNKACFCCAGTIPSIPPTRSWRITGKEKSLFISHTAIKNALYKQVLVGVLSLRSMTLNFDWI